MARVKASWPVGIRNSSKSGLLKGLAVLLAVSAACFGAAIPRDVRAQNGVGILPPTVSPRDANGVDLINGSLTVPTPTLAAGSNGSGISRTGLGYNPIMDNLSGAMTAGFYSGNNYNGMVTVTVNGESEDFYYPNRNADGEGVSFESQYYVGCSPVDRGIYPSGPQDDYTGCVLPVPPQSPSPTSLSCSGTTCTYVMRDGTVATFLRTPSYGPIMMGVQGNFGRITKLQKPDGEVLTYSYWEKTVVQPIYNQPGLTFTILTPLQVTSSLGWTVRYQYSSNEAGAPPPSRIAIVNATIDYCDPNAGSCSAADQATWPYFENRGYYPNSGENVSLTAAGTSPWQTYYVSGYSSSFGGNISATLYPGAGSQNYYYWDNDYKVKTLTRNGATWSYDYTPVSGVNTTTVTNPDGSKRRLTFAAYDNGHPGTGRRNSVTSIQDELGRTTNYFFYYGSRYLKQIMPPETTWNGLTPTGGYTKYDYDYRWNVITSTTYPKGGGTPIVTSAAYPPTCTYRVNCNKPTSVTDANGNVTTYTYDNTHGGVLTETGPAINGVQTQKRYSYSQITPWLKSSTGTMVAQAPVWRLTGTSVCRSMTLATCVGTADELKTTISYGTDNTHPVYNNVLPVSETTMAGDGSISTTIYYTYDNFGHVTSVKGPRTDVDDTRYTTYDMYGRPLLQISADPDGSGPLLRQATRTTYDAEGRVLKVETGTTSTTIGSDFTAKSYVSNTYNTTNGLLSQSQKVILP